MYILSRLCRPVGKAGRVSIVFIFLEAGWEKRRASYGWYNGPADDGTDEDEESVCLVASLPGCEDG